MTKTDLIDKVAEKSGLTKKDSGEAVTAVFEAVVEFLAEESNKPEAEREKVQIIGFGSFEVKDRDARKGRNPRTGKEIEIPARSVPIFKAGKALKESVQ
ncbi:MAG: HU family DNA-binding protein [Halanaerobiales bacterium]|nr:HU family DNA-binding protein [Halanaerobiales bacterium]